MKRYEKELEDKLEREKKVLAESYQRIRKSVEESEKERYEFEIEKFRKEQSKNLESKKVDIEKLKSEKRKIQS